MTRVGTNLSSAVLRSLSKHHHKYNYCQSLCKQTERVCKELPFVLKVSLAPPATSRHGQAPPCTGRFKWRMSTSRL